MYMTFWNFLTFDLYFHRRDHNLVNHMIETLEDMKLIEKKGELFQAKDKSNVS